MCRPCELGYISDSVSVRTHKPRTKRWRHTRAIADGERVERRRVKATKRGRCEYAWWRIVQKRSVEVAVAMIPFHDVSYQSIIADSKCASVG